MKLEDLSKWLIILEYYQLFFKNDFPVCEIETTIRLHIPFIDDEFLLKELMAVQAAECLKSKIEQIERAIRVLKNCMEDQ